MSNSEIKLLLSLMLPIIAFWVAEYLWYRRWVWKKSDLPKGEVLTYAEELELPSNVISIRRGIKS